MPAAKKEQPILYEFYGTECTHCKEMEPLIDKLQKEENIKITRLEVWHNAQNQRLLEQVDNGKCGGVPFFFNTKTKEGICGNCDYERLKKWALGK